MRAPSIILSLVVLSAVAFAAPKVVGNKIVTETIYFETGKADLKRESIPTLDAIVAVFARDRKLGLVEIGVHTDARGRDQWNLELSQKRANAVRDYLIAKGVDGNRLRAKGYGETRPIDRRANEAAWSKNRRTEFVIIQRSTT
jgi:outer membrane protein OmpA-like peptidoglycan-associated protein